MAPQPKYPHSARGWEPFQALITQLYRDEDRPLKEVMQIMETQHGFKATEKMYKSRIRAWRLDKKNKRAEVQEILRLRETRKLLGKKSAFILRDRPVDMDNVERYVKRTGLSVQPAGPAPTQSSALLDLICFTPPPTPRLLDAPMSLLNVEEFLHSLDAFVEHSLQSGMWRRGNDIMGFACIISDHLPWSRNEFVMSIERGISRFNLGNRRQAYWQWLLSLSQLKPIVCSGSPSQLLMLVELIAHLAECEDEVAALLLRYLGHLVQEHHHHHHQASNTDTRLRMLQSLSRIEAKDTTHLLEISYDYSRRVFSNRFSRESFFLLDTETVLLQQRDPRPEPGPAWPAPGGSRFTDLLAEWKTYDAEALRVARSAMEILMASKQYDEAESFALMHIGRIQEMPYDGVVAGALSHTYSYLTHLYLRAENLEGAYHFTHMKVKNYFEMLLTYRTDIPEDFILSSFALLACLARSLGMDKEAEEWTREYDILKARTDALVETELSRLWGQAGFNSENLHGQFDAAAEAEAETEAEAEAAATTAAATAAAARRAPDPSPPTITLPDIVVEDRQRCRGHKIHRGGRISAANTTTTTTTTTTTAAAAAADEEERRRNWHEIFGKAQSEKDGRRSRKHGPMQCSSDGNLSRWHEHTCFHRPTR